nr:Haloacid dehalogenase hydrolase domain containing protein [Haemonchus contortus]
MKTTDSTAVRNCMLSSPAHKSKDGHFSEDITRPLCPESFRELLPDIDTFIFDADGVLWLGDDAIPGSVRLIDFLVKIKKQVIVLTNNATKSRAVYAKKLARLGFSSKLDEDSLVNPAAVIADTLYRAGITGNKKVYLIGAQGVRDEMDALGIQYFGHGPEPQDDSDGSAFMFDIELEEDPSEVGAVVVGYEKHFDYHKLMKASNYLQHPHCLFLATNEDETCPGPNPDIITPDAGPIVAAVRCASGREPITVGKPNTPAFDYIRRRWRINPERTIMVGDRTNTDIKFGRDHGLKTLLVLSGCHQLEDVTDNRIHGDFDMVPDFYATCLGALIAPPMKIVDPLAVSGPHVGSSEVKNDHFDESISKPLCPESFRELLPHIDTFIFDADGVLWLGDDVIPGSPRLVDFLIKSGKRVIILTNNATKSRAVYAKKLARLGFNRKLDKNSLVNPAAVVADALDRAGLADNKKVYLIGAQGVRDEMDDLGIEYFGHGPEPQDDSDGSAFMFDIELEEDPSDVGAVVVGYEKHFNYHKLMKAANYLQKRHCLFLATNEDETCPGPNADVVTPDAGPLVAAVRCASGREPITVGKPNTPAFDYIRRRWNIDPERTMMVGDRTNTDVKFGRDHGLKTMLVLSGCHQLEDILDNHRNGLLDMVPDYYTTCLGSLLPHRDHA